MLFRSDKYNHGAIKEDINYVAGWVAGQMATKALSMAGSEPTRAKLVDAMSKGFTVDTKGLSAPIVFTPTDHAGPTSFRVVGYDYSAKKYKPFGDFSDLSKYITK